MKNKIECNEKNKNFKRVVKKIDKSKVSSFGKQKNNNEVDLWKEIRTNFKPLVKAYKKFSEKRRIAKQKEHERKLKQDEKQKLREEELLKLKEQEERRLKRQKKTKEDKEKRLQDQEKQRLEEKRIKDDRVERIKQEEIYREKLAKAEEERINQIKRVNEARNEERKLREQRYSDIENKFYKKPNAKEERLNKEELRLKKKEQRLINEEQRLQEKEQSLKEEQKINLKDVKRSDADVKQNKKRLNGTVLWFNDTKGYGCIKREDKEKNIFVHFSALQNSGLSFLKVDDLLTFEVEHSDTGLSAVNLQKTVNELFRPQLKVIK